jgi:1-acyl-sn-glycerol-3-phosphate acyltransferase
MAGEIPAQASLLAANHVSWLDVFVINSVCPSRFVAKSELRDWPIVGWLCAKGGTFFLQRERREELKKINETLTGVLQSGQRVAVFPEGTTSEGGTLGHLHTSLFETAVRAQVRVVPIALRFSRADGSLNRDVAFVGETTFWESVRNVLAQPEVLVTLSFAHPLSSIDRNRRELAREAERAIVSALIRSTPETAPDRQAAPRSIPVPTRSRYPARADLGEARAPALTNDRKSLGH